MKKVTSKLSIAFIFGSKYITVFINLIINAVLARILGPEDFGIVAVISVFIAFFTILADVGIGTAIIQKNNLSKKEIGMLFAISFFFSVIIVLVFILFSILISKFYENTVYIKLGVFLAISLFFNTLNTIPNALLMKKEAFIHVGIRTLLASVLSGAISIYSALNGAMYYSLVIQTIICSIIIFTWNYINTKPEFVWKIDPLCIKKVRSFSSYWFAYNLLNYFARNLDNLIIGKITGPGALGYYDKAYKLMLYPVQNLTYVLNPILHPILAKENGNQEVIYSRYIGVLKALSLIAVFISVYSLVCADNIIYVIFGPKWTNSVLSFKILSMSIWFQVTSSTSGVIYASIEKTKLLFKSGMIYIPCQVVLFLLAALTGKIEVMALGAMIGLIGKFFIDYYILLTKGFERSFGVFLSNFKSEIAIYIICYFVLSFSEHLLINNELLDLAVKFMIGGIVFLVSLLIFDQFKYIKFFWKKN